MHRKVSIVALVAALALMIPVLAACGGDDSSAEEPAVAGIRTPQPTFTPTAVGNAPAAPETQTLSDPASATVAGTAPADPAAAPAAAPAADAAAAPAAVAEAPTQAPVQPGFGGPVTPPPSPTGPPPLGVVNTELVNSRSGPDTTFGVVMVLGRGEQYDVTGKSADGTWWRLCCVENKDVWAKAEFVDVATSTEGVPVAQAGDVSAASLALLNPQAATAPAVVEQVAAAAVTVAEAPAATPLPAPVVAAATAPPEPSAPVAAPPPDPSTDVVAAAAATGDGSHALVASERFPESNVVRVFLYVYQGSEALAGYTLRVTKDGVEQTVSGASFGGMAGLTWPIADERQRFQNFKVEFPGVAPAGTWTVELVKDGAVVGPAATFTLSENETATELYVRYERR